MPTVAVTLASAGTLVPPCEATNFIAPMKQADQPAALSHLARLRIAFVPAEVFCSLAQTFDKLTLREGPIGFFGIDLGVVQNTELDRVQS